MSLAGSPANLRLYSHEVMSLTQISGAVTPVLENPWKDRGQVTNTSPLAVHNLGEVIGLS